MRHNFKASFLVFLAVWTVFFTGGFNPGQVKAAAFDIEAESAILVDAETGKILFEKQPDIKLPPASMTKMMTEYLVLEAIQEGQIDWDTTTQISDYAYEVSADTSSSGIGLIQDKEYTVSELYEAMAVISDNATTIALAELIAGSEGEFVKMMNKKAEEMGLPDYKFVNSTGLSNQYLGDNYPEGTEPDAENLLSAKSTALLAYHLVNDFPEVLETSSKLTTELDGRELTNINWMLPLESVYVKQYHYPGIDGLKTGFTDAAGYCFTGTAERNGRRLISVVMRTESKGARFEETAQLMDYGFTEFENTEIFPAGYQIEGESTLPVAKGKEETVKIASKDALKATVKKGEEESYQAVYQINEEQLNSDGELTAPVEEGEKVGTVELNYQGEVDFGYITDKENRNTTDLVTTEAVAQANWFALSMSAVGGFFSNIFTGVSDTVKGMF